MLLPGQITLVDENEIAEADSLLRTGLENRVKMLEEMTWEERFSLLGHDLWKLGLKLLILVAIFVVGRWLIRRLVKMLDNFFEKRKVDPSIRTFIRGFLDIILYLSLLYLMIVELGINTTMFVALFAAAGLAIGMALSGVFQNLAGGVMILSLRPFRVGDWITTQGQTGRVMDIRLFNTVLRTADNRTILLPNGNVSNGIVDNYTSAKTRRVEWTLQLRLGTDFDVARCVIHDILKAERRIIASPPFEIWLSKLNSNSIEITVYAWVASDDFWDVFYGMNWVLYKTLHEKGFHAPSQSIAVTLTNNEGSKGLSKDSSLEEEDSLMETGKAPDDTPDADDGDGDDDGDDGDDGDGDGDGIM